MSQPIDSDGTTSLLPIHDYLNSPDHESFVWDKTGEETSETWLRPVRDAGLDPRKHKVFSHNNKEYTTQPYPFQHDGELGDSGSTIVYRVRAPVGYTYRRPLALKVIVCKESTRPPGPDSNARRLALQEVRNMAAIQHPHIVVYVASFEDYCIQTKTLTLNHRRPHRTSNRPKESFHINQQTIKKHILGIAMYPPAQCNLQTFMHECVAWSRNPSQRSNGSNGSSRSAPNGGEDETEGWWKIPYMLTYFGCLGQAVAYLHRSNVRIRHKDIKPENVVIDHFGKPVLTDFGLSKHFETGHHSDGPTAKTLKYADPEAMHETTRDERSDIFSLGCVYLEMATVLLGRPPLFAENQLRAAAAAAAATMTGETPATTDEFKYSETLHGLDDYIAELTRISVDDAVHVPDEARRETLRAVASVLPTIRRMMHEDFHKRPYAHELFPLFRHLYDVPGTPDVCASCEAERQTGGFTPKSGSQRSGRGSPTMLRRDTMGSAAVARRTSSTMVAQVSYSPTKDVTMDGT